LTKSANAKLRRISARIIQCRRCPRLVRYREKVARQKKRQYLNQKYWGRPLPGFGDNEARVLIIGLAPAAHGGNRTGRMFTGDSSGDWLARALHATGFANQPTSNSKNDGFKLTDVYITAAARCAPPANKPTKIELAKCSEYLANELDILHGIRVVIALGRVAFDSFLKLKNLRLNRYRFAHGEVHRLQNLYLISSYHPSRQNTQTGKLTWDMWIGIFSETKRILDIEP
jgi:uracil-DNA glycosylase family 4